MLPKMGPLADSTCFGYPLAELLDVEAVAEGEISAATEPRAVATGSWIQPAFGLVRHQKIQEQC